MPLGFSHEYEPDFVNPFHWAPDPFTYFYIILHIKITPKISQLYAENVNPMVKHIKDKMLCWKQLPVTFLGRVSPIKMIIVPKIIYPLSMLFITLKKNNTKDR